MEIRKRSLIVGGHDAPQGRYPYFASFDHFGGGVLIAPDMILTAGHVYPPPQQIVKVRLNHPDLTQPGNEETFAIASLHRHPGYYESTWDEKSNDYNLLQIKGFSKVKPVKLNRDPKVPSNGATVTTIGLGSTSPDPATFVDTAANILQEVDLKIISHAKCGRSHDHKRGISYSGRIDKANMICTSGGPHNEKDACAFDSGSPIMLTPENSEQKEDLVVAIVSWGIDCADPFFPAVNARVSFAMDWIDETVCKVSNADPSQLAEFQCERFQDHRFNWRRFIRPPTHKLWGRADRFQGGVGMLNISYVACFCLVVVLVGTVFQKMLLSSRAVPISRNESERRSLNSYSNVAPSYDSLPTRP